MKDEDLIGKNNLFQVVMTTYLRGGTWQCEIDWKHVNEPDIGKSL